MVGVAGRSKGCATCRRRALGCDLERPSCRRCSRNGRQCEGYEVFPVFINQNGSSKYRREAPLQVIKVLPSPVLYDQQLSAALLEVYLPPTEDHWIYGAVSMLGNSDALRLSLRALSLNRLGFNSNNQDMVCHGLATYGGAMTCVRSKLRQSAGQNEDSTLLAIRVLSLFEAFGQSEISSHGWNTHENGVAALLSLRGIPSSELAVSIYREAWRSSVLTSFMNLQPPCLQPEPVSADDKEGLLWKLAFELAHLNIRIRAATADSSAHLTMERAMTLMQECTELDEMFQSWEDSISVHAVPYTLHANQTTSDSPFQDRYKFASDDHDYMYSYYWAFRAMLSIMVLHMIEKLPTENIFSVNALSSGAAEALPVYWSSARTHFETTRHTCAVQIIRGCHFALAPNRGHYGAYRISFSVLVALYAFQESGDVAGIMEAVDVVKILAKEKGLNFASLALERKITINGWGEVLQPRRNST